MRAPVGHFRRLATLQAKGLILVSAGVVLLMATLSARPFSDRPMSAGPSRTVADFSLLDQDGRMHQLSRYAGSRAVVLFVHGVGCNVARDSMPTLNALRDRYTVPESDFMMPARREVPLADRNLLQRAWQRFGYVADRFLTQRWLDQARERNVLRQREHVSVLQERVRVVERPQLPVGSEPAVEETLRAKLR